jgi:outer membrane protein assembly factor BamB
LLAVLLLSITLTGAAQANRRVALGDWPEIRGPLGDGTSAETGLPETWEIGGENFLWRAPFGGRSTPIVLGDRLYVQNPSGRGPELQERVMALEVDTGEVVWEYKFNVFQSDVPTHRVAWASPAADPETGNVYAMSGNAQVIALDPDGRLLWDRSFGEEWAAFTTHGGRTGSPAIYGDLVIVSAAISSWGSHWNRAHRLVALDKRTGDIVYATAPGGRPYDTAYAPPLFAAIGGQRLLIQGLGNGGVHAIQPLTGQVVWSFPFSRRAINTGVVVKGDRVFVSQGDENLEGNELGTIASIVGSRTGEITETVWERRGLEFGFSSPVTDGETLYQIDSGSTLHAFDMDTGALLWSEPLGNAQRAHPVLADGKMYLGTNGGSFYIIRPSREGAEILSQVTLPVSTDSCCGSEGTAEQIVASAAVSRGRIYFVSSDAVYAFGPSEPRVLEGWALDEPVEASAGPPAHVQVVPTEMVLDPGETVSLRVRLFDAQGRFIREADSASWELEGLSGVLNDDGTFTSSAEGGLQAGVIRATVGELSGESRARVVHPLPWTEGFDGYEDGGLPPGWVNTQAGRFVVSTLEGEKVFEKPPDDTLFARARAFIGPVDWSDYSFQADVRAPIRRRQMADVGVTVQTYSLVLYGTTQQLKLVPWEPETERTVTVPFAWEPDAWYRLRLRVDNLPDGQVRARGKAWRVGEPEPEAWLIDRVDPIGSRNGAPGLFVNAPQGAYLDNFVLVPNAGAVEADEADE